MGVAGAGVTGPGAVSGAWAARGSCSSSRAVEPDGRRRRRRLDGPAARSGLALAAGGAATAGGSGSAGVVPLAGERRRRRLGVLVTATATGGFAGRRLPRQTPPALPLAPPLA